MLTVVDRQRVGRDRWDEVVESAPAGWVWALWDWQELILKVERWGLEDVSFAIADDQQVVATVALQWQAASKSLSGTGFGLTAPAVMPSPGSAAITSEVFSRVRAIAAEKGAARIAFGLSPAAAGAADLTANPFVAFGFEDQSSHARVLDLRHSDEALLMQFSRDTRQQIRRAAKHGIAARQVSWPEYLDHYYRLHTETYQRTGEVPHPYEYFQGIATRLAARGNSVLWCAFAPDGEPIAFHNTARLGTGAMYHTGCSASQALETGANYLVFWEALRGARDSGCERYEIGEVFLGEVEGKKRGLTTFKSKFGGDTVNYFRGVITQPPPAPPPDDSAKVRDAYERSPHYDPSNICRKVQAESADYVDRLLADKFAALHQYDRGGTLVDLCCAAGEHVIDMSRHRPSRAIGLDFSWRYLERAQGDARSQAAAVNFVAADARHLPIADGKISTLYCFSSIYAIPDPKLVVAEIGRVLAPGGRAVIDFGNRRSLNVFCLRYYPELPGIHALTLREMRDALRDAGLHIIAHRSFQLLPLWTDRPSWLWPLLHPFWKRVMRQRLAGRMVDEWISSLPLIRNLAFRHLFVCERA